MSENVELQRLRRGLGSRLVGDGLSGNLIPSQLVLACSLFFVNESRVALVVAAVFLVPAVAAVTWSAHLEGACLVGTICWIPVHRIRLLHGSSASLESVSALRGETTMIRVDGVVVEKGRSIGGDGRSAYLGYTRFMSRDRSDQWIVAIHNATRPPRW
jgi:hypothetical protein